MIVGLHIVLDTGIDVEVNVDIDSDVDTFKGMIKKAWTRDDLGAFLDIANIVARKEDISLIYIEDKSE